MKLTIDSSEPLEHALRVLGALYGVTLSVADNGQDGGPEQDARPVENARSATKRRQAGATTARPVAPATKAGGRKPKRKTARESAGTPGNAEVRSWARQNGMAVNERGRVPAAVLTAYRDANQV